MINGMVAHEAKDNGRLSSALDEAYKALAAKTAECEALKNKLNRAEVEIEKLSLDLGLRK